MRVKDAFDVLVKETPPVGVILERPKSTALHIIFSLPKNNKSDLDTIYIPFIIAIVDLLVVLFLFDAGLVLPALMLVFFGIPYLTNRTKKQLEEKRFTHLSLELTPKGGQVYKIGVEGKKKLQSYYKWGELVAISVKKIPKSKQKIVPYYIHLETKNNAVKLLNQKLSTEEISYAASMLEALLDQRYRGTVPDHWRKSLETLLEPVLVDWSDHLIDDE